MKIYKKDIKELTTLFKNNSITCVDICDITLINSNTLRIEINIDMLNKFNIYCLIFDKNNFLVSIDIKENKLIYNDVVLISKILDLVNTYVKNLLYERY